MVGAGRFERPTPCAQDGRGNAALSGGKLLERWALRARLSTGRKRVCSQSRSCWFPRGPTSRRHLVSLPYNGYMSDMPLQVEAVYENGVLRLLEPLDLREHERVIVSVSGATPGRSTL